MVRQRGVALLMALWALALVGLLLPGLLAAGKVQIQSARLKEGDHVARSLLAGAERVAVTGLMSAAARTQRTFWQAMRGEVLAYRLEGADIRVELRDLNSCFNVNALAGPDSERAIEQLVYLLEHRAGGFDEPGLTAQSFAQRLADWVDSDGQMREQGMETLEAQRLTPPAIVGDQLMVDASEIDLVPPRRSGRIWRYPELCAFSDAGGWRLNANALTLRDLPLLDALFLGRVPQSLLQRLITARPSDGYRNLEALRSAVGSGSSEEAFALMTQRLVLNGSQFLLGVEIQRDGQRYRYVRHLLAEGVSRWNAHVPAQRVKMLARQNMTLWEPGVGVVF
ncbi:general secretion pathway protein GspK [Pseudomonas matsuisoli]|uniref:Type II secretion system protein K n=1 Tax=Pseudomonas matsuisoli TaxID=1515666 RepID=A0A917Q276_9PSED|nr:type II secretion system protein GspK [Pseudomonas matsuisoli]GGK07253.1 hypothetical protein GCM10009304_36860 [Pseudomonas matsuisoli]